MTAEFQASCICGWKSPRFKVGFITPEGTRARKAAWICQALHHRGNMYHTTNIDYKPGNY